MIVNDATMKEFSAGLSACRTLAVPYGTVEAHGPHLPLGTDTLIICEVLAAAAKRVPMAVAPPVNYGVCTSTGPHAGTIGISPSTLRRLTADIVGDGHAKGFRNFLLISGHGGGLHCAAMKEAAEGLLRELEGALFSALCIYDLVHDEAARIAETENDSHAGEIETSLVMHLRPDLVKGTAAEQYPSLPKPYMVRDKVAYWPGAVWGDPSKASAEKGERLFSVMVGKVAALVEGFEGVDPR
ncbi:MAG TPA: creatininase family protein [Deltaproteobacteria bacterium]|nr:creatininase family protein [Deltaproteobacteria bacterium]